MDNNREDDWLGRRTEQERKEPTTYNGSLYSHIAKRGDGSKINNLPYIQITKDKEENHENRPRAWDRGDQWGN